MAARNHTHLIRDHRMCLAIAECARVDEALDIRDKSTAIGAYARQRDDVQLDVWMSEIRLRASLQIGILIREMDKDDGFRGNQHKERNSEQPDLPRKLDAIKATGISKTTAYEYQNLSGGSDPAAQAVAATAAEQYFEKSRAEMKPASMEGRKAVVREAVVATLGLTSPGLGRKVGERTTGEADIRATPFSGSNRPDHDIYPSTLVRLLMVKSAVHNKHNRREFKSEPLLPLLPLASTRAPVVGQRAGYALDTTPS